MISDISDISQINKARKDKSIMKAIIVKRRLKQCVAIKMHVQTKKIKTSY